MFRCSFFFTFLFLSTSAFAQSYLKPEMDSLQQGWSGTAKITLENQDAIKGDWVQLKRVGHDLYTHYTGDYNTTFAISVGVDPDAGVELKDYPGTISIYSNNQKKPEVIYYAIKGRGLTFTEVGNRGETRICRYAITDDKLYCRINLPVYDIYEVYVRPAALPPLPKELPASQAAPTIIRRTIRPSSGTTAPQPVPVEVPAPEHTYPLVIPDPAHS